MGGEKRREDAQREKRLEIDISSTTLHALDAFKDKNCDPRILNSFTSKDQKFYKDSGSISVLWNNYTKKYSNRDLNQSILRMEKA